MECCLAFSLCLSSISHSNSEKVGSHHPSFMIFHSGIHVEQFQKYLLIGNNLLTRVQCYAQFPLLLFLGLPLNTKVIWSRKIPALFLSDIVSYIIYNKVTVSCNIKHIILEFPGLQNNISPSHLKVNFLGIIQFFKCQIFHFRFFLIVSFLIRCLF